MTKKAGSEKLTTVERRIANHKSVLLEKFQQVPIVQVACQRAGVGRATYYRWRRKDERFAKEADQAICEGIKLINDMAESQLIGGIKERNLTAIIYWLKHRHSAYSTRIEVAGRIKHEHVELSPEQAELIEKAIDLISLPGREGNNDN